MKKALSTTALQLIQQGWTQRAYARDARGQIVSSNSDDAVCWCSIGAIGAAYGYGTENYRSIERFEEVVERFKEVVGSNIASWNDEPTRTKEEIIEAFMKAGI